MQLSWEAKTMQNAGLMFLHMLQATRSPASAPSHQVVEKLIEPLLVPCSLAESPNKNFPF